jgi:tetratricopeptide (TPR) repeat protein
LLQGRDALSPTPGQPTPGQAPAQGPPAADRGLEFKPGWLLITLSAVVVVLLRNHRAWLAAYAGLVTAVLIFALVWGPKFLGNAEKRLHREALKHLSLGDLPALNRLADSQWLLSRFGRRHVVTELRALAEARLGDATAAVVLYTRALAEAPPTSRPVVELNLAEAELAAAHTHAGEGRLRALIERQPRNGRARAALGRSLLARGEALDEAAAHLEVAVAEADSRSLPTLQRALDEARARAT